MPSQNLIKSFKTGSALGASASIASVMPVNSVVKADNGCPGLIKASKVSMTLPSCILTAASSIIESYTEDKPVVSTSNTT